MLSQALLSTTAQQNSHGTDAHEHLSKEQPPVHMRCTHARPTCQCNTSVHPLLKSEKEFLFMKTARGWLCVSREESRLACEPGKVGPGGRKDLGRGAQAAAHERLDGCLEKQHGPCQGRVRCQPLPVLGPARLARGLLTGRCSFRTGHGSRWSPHCMRLGAPLPSQKPCTCPASPHMAPSLSDVHGESSNGITLVARPHSASSTCQATTSAQSIEVLTAS